MFTSLTVQGLVDCLSHLPPVELAALRLVRELPLTSAGVWFPAVPPDGVAEATRELIDYTKSCAALVDKLKYLAPITLPTLEIPEWPL
jgi:hypothetical protein